ncbi:MAG TPA: enoyl-CoA hydratase-related protein [Longimicrobiales bacterium]|nr:enoyl-CoA hydratase-related protein [Longimicrobiales bacterium]
MSYQRILYDVHAPVARITMNRPEKRNALDTATIDELQAALTEAERAAAVSVVLLRGAGRDFCAGVDLAGLQRIAEGAGPTENLADAMRLGELLIAMRRHRCIIVGAVQGNAVAGGAGLATACDLILAADDAVFGYPEVNLGFVPAMVMTLLRRALGEKLALELAVRGERIDAAHALRIGLINHIFARDSFDAAVEQWVTGLGARSGSALQLTKRLFYGMEGVPFEEAIRRGAEVNVLARYTDDCRDGVRRFLERQK